MIRQKRLGIVFVITLWATIWGVLSSGKNATGEEVDIPMVQGGEEQPSLLPEDTASVRGDDELFGSEGGYFHPYITVGVEYTDNLYNLENGEEDNWLTRLSPGIWFALPRKDIIPLNLNPHNSSPGGLQLQFADYEGKERFQTYLLGGLDFKWYTANSELNTTDGILEGLARVNLRGGLSLQLVDRFSHGHDNLEYGSSERNQQRAFNSNFVMATADWDITEKFRVKFDYFNFFLGYEEDVNQFLDRIDNGIDLYGYYNFSPVTQFFLEYRVVDVAYDQSTELDSVSNYLFAGVKWFTTDKFSLMAKVGFQNKAFENSNMGQKDFDGVAVDVQLEYDFTEKTSIEANLYRSNEETDTYLASDKTVTGLSLRYQQYFTDRIVGLLEGYVEKAEYSNLSAFSDNGRDDLTIMVRPALQYLFREWLMFEIAYRYDQRDSTDDRFDYTSNTFIFNANFSF